MTKAIAHKLNTLLVSKLTFKTVTLVAVLAILFVVFFQAASIKLVDTGEQVAAISIAELVFATGDNDTSAGDGESIVDENDTPTDADTGENDAGGENNNEEVNDTDNESNVEGDTSSSKEEEEKADDESDVDGGSEHESISKSISKYGGSSSSGGGHKHKKKPVCTLDASPSSIAPGGNATLSWTSKYVTDGSIDQGIGAISPVAAGDISVSPTENTNYTATFTGSYGKVTCSTYIKVKTPPSVPVCPIPDSSDRVSSKDRILIIFDPEKRLYSNRSENSSVSGPVSVSIPAGSYIVKLATFDNHSDKPGQTQSNEQWHLGLVNSVGTVALSASISDLPDDDDYIVEDVNNELVLAEDVTEAFAYHSAFPNKSPSNSLLPICAALDPIVVEEPEPMCTLTIDPATIQNGGTASIDWTSENVTDGSIDQGIGAISPVAAGGISVSPSADTTYTATFTGPYGEVTCSESISVVENPVPMCTLTIDPTTVQNGNSAILNWTSANVTNGSIDQSVGTTTPVDGGSVDVSPTTDTTYTAIFTGPYGDVECSASVAVVEEPVPMCTLTIDPTAITGGGTAALSWTSENVTEGVIDQGIGTTTPVVAGSLDVTPIGDTTYTAFFTGQYGDVQCSASITVGTSSSSSSGGSSSSSGGSSSGGRPDVTLTKATPESQLGFITLSQLPYTGFPAGPIATSIFFTVLLVWSGVLAYFISVRGYGRIFMNRLIADKSASQSQRFYGIPRDLGVMASAASVSVPGNSAFAGAGEQKDDGISLESPITSEERETDNVSSSLREQLEEQSHEAGVLLSDEGLSYMAGMGAAAPEMLGELIERAREAYPREDGWIHLNVERTRLLMGDANPTTVAFDNEYSPARSQAMDIPTNLPTTARSEVRTHEVSSPTGVTIPTFIGWIATGDMERAFSHLRVLRAHNRSATDFLAETLCELDDAYQFQLEGERTVHAGTLQATKPLSKHDVEQVIEYLLSGVDHSYFKEQVGVKMALLRALSYTKRKRQK